jgi:L-2,4-diaminobutyric acid acetyltransferase
METTRPRGTVLYRRPLPDDASAVWRLVKESGKLDPNSAYCYMLLFNYFAGTCLVAEREERIIGFVTAFAPPEPVERESLFVWQIAVAPEARGQGVATALLRQLLALPACRSAARLEATVSPGNGPSRRLFEAFARERGTVLETAGMGFPAALFPEQGHEDEPIVRISLTV